jgi:hypothetical protein
MSRPAVMRRFDPAPLDEDLAGVWLKTVVATAVAGGGAGAVMVAGSGDSRLIALAPTAFILGWLNLAGL